MLKVETMTLLFNNVPNMLPYFYIQLQLILYPIEKDIFKIFSNRYCQSNSWI